MASEMSARILTGADLQRQVEDAPPPEVCMDAANNVHELRRRCIELRRQRSDGVPLRRLKKEFRDVLSRYPSLFDKLADASAPDGMVYEMLDVMMAGLARMQAGKDYQDTSAIIGRAAYDKFVAPKVGEDSAAT